MGGEIGGAERMKTDAEQERAAENEKNRDGHDLDHRKPVLERAEAGDAARVHVNHSRGKRGDPNPLRNSGKPQTTINRRGDNFAADGHDLAEPVGVAHDEAGPTMDVHLGVHAKRAGNRVRDGHFAERPHQSECDGCAGNVAENDSGTGQAHGDGTAEEQARTNGAADGNHRKLARGQIAVKARFAGKDLLFGSGNGRGRRSGLPGHGAGVMVSETVSCCGARTCAWRCELSGLPDGTPMEIRP